MTSVVLVKTVSLGFFFPVFHFCTKVIQIYFAHFAPLCFEKNILEMQV